MKFKPNREYKIENGRILVREIGRANAGNCYYCGKPVWISRGQIITYLIIKRMHATEEYPTHKLCRKNNKIIN